MRKLFVTLQLDRARKFLKEIRSKREDDPNMPCSNDMRPEINYNFLEIDELRSEIAGLRKSIETLEKENRYLKSNSGGFDDKYRKIMIDKERLESMLCAVLNSVDDSFIETVEIKQKTPGLLEFKKEHNNEDKDRLKIHLAEFSSHERELMKEILNENP